jgi:hypothetical protein
MKSAIETSKTILLALCLVLIAGAVISAQTPTPTDKSEKADKPQEKTKPVKKLTAETEEQRKFYDATTLTAAALAKGEIELAKTSAEALLKQAETMKDDWNYGNALHVANLVLGRIALLAGDTKEAKRFLLEAGKTPGSPQLNSFGPNMLLAKELLEKKETAVVLEYFELCAKFWKRHTAKLDEWKAAVEKNEIPEFGANLRYQLYQF